LIVTQRVPPAHTEPSDSTKPSPSNAKGGSTRSSLVFPRAPHNPPLPPPPRGRPRQCAANHSPRMLTRCASVPSMPLRRAIQRAAIEALSAPDAAHHTHYPTPFFPAPLRHNPVSPRAHRCQVAGLFYVSARSNVADLLIMDEQCLNGIRGGGRGSTVAVMSPAVQPSPPPRMPPTSPPSRTPPPPVQWAELAPPSTNKIEKDPHLYFAHGGRADFRGLRTAMSLPPPPPAVPSMHAPLGRHLQLYNFFSAPGLSANLRMENATFTLHGSRHSRAPDGPKRSLLTNASIECCRWTPDGL